MKKLKFWGLVVIIFILFYLIFIYLDKQDQETLENCKKENSTQYCMRSIYG